MWIEVSKDIFDKADFKSLNFLYQIISWYPSGSQSRYNIFVNTEKVKKSKNFIKLKEIESQIESFLDVEFDYFINSMSSKRDRDYSITYQKGKTNFSIEEAIQFFNQPVSIILENNKNDSSFIISIIENFGKQNGRNKSVEHIENAWLKFENAGGCSNIPNFMQMFLKQFEKLALKNNRAVSEYFRGFIIIDSDREFSSQQSKHSNLINKMNKLGITNFHILEKRMMENYMPDEVFEDLRTDLQSNPLKNVDLINWINVYLNLQPNFQGKNEKQDYLSIYIGKLKGGILPTPTDLIGLYNLPQKDFDILDRGFKYKGKEFKNEFPLLFLQSTNVNKETLTKKSGTNELQQIMDKISQLL